MTTINRLSKHEIVAHNVYLDHFFSDKPICETTVVHNDILIHEFKTTFKAKVSVTLENNSNYDLNLDGYFHQVDDEWSGFLVEKVTVLNNTEPTIYIDSFFKQRLQGILFTNETLLDRLLQPC